MYSGAKDQRLAKRLAKFILGRRNDSLRIVKVAAVLMAVLYFVRGPAASAFGSRLAQSAALREVQPPENYYGASRHQMHGYLGLMPDGKPSWEPSAPPQTPDLAAALRDNGFHVRLSDSISLDRNTTDFRDPLCKLQRYHLNELLATSVIFVFHNEALSTLLRSIHSVLNRTPPRLLREIILVDDASTKAWLQDDLEHHIKFLPKVRLVRMPVRSGLVKARLRGIEEARAETFTVLDSHIEVQDGWLEPLMWRVTQSPMTVVMPIIDTVDAATFEFSNQGIGCTLGFLWSLVEHSIDTQAKDEAIRTSPIDPVRSPTMAGGLFAANKEFFLKLGGYDPEWGFWGAENLELSFRLWQCGGSLECMPCSRVYHIFRQGGVPYSAPQDHLPKNRLRTAAIWMDEYGAVVRKTYADTPIDIGPLDHMLKLRKDLQCKSFSWYLHNVYPESFIVDMADVVTMDILRNPATNLCLEGADSPGELLQLAPCLAGDVVQSFLLHRNGQLRPIMNLELCVTRDLSLVVCEWVRDSSIVWVPGADGTLQNSKTSKCISATKAVPVMTDCSARKELRWEIIPYKPEQPAQPALA